MKEISSAMESMGENIRSQLEKIPFLDDVLNDIAREDIENELNGITEGKKDDLWFKLKKKIFLVPLLGPFLNGLFGKVKAETSDLKETIESPYLDLANVNENNAKIAKRALEWVGGKNTQGAEHCTERVDKVVKDTIGKSVYDLPTIFNGVKNISIGTKIGVKEYAPKNAISQITAGMHLIVDKPAYGQGNTHSVITLGKADINGNIKVASFPNTGNKPPAIETYNINGDGSGDIKNGKILRIQGFQGPSKSNETFSQTISRKDAIAKYGNTPAVRNFNPGNMRRNSLGYPIGKDNFTVFPDPKTGFDALVGMIERIQSGENKMYNKNGSLMDFIKVYAPASDNNNPQQHAANIAGFLGISTSVKVSDLDPHKLAKGIARFEDGSNYKMLEDLHIV